MVSTFFMGIQSVHDDLQRSSSLCCLVVLASLPQVKNSYARRLQDAPSSPSLGIGQPHSLPPTCSHHPHQWSDHLLELIRFNGGSSNLMARTSFSTHEAGILITNQHSRLAEREQHTSYEQCK